MAVKCEMRVFDNTPKVVDTHSFEASSFEVALAVFAGKVYDEGGAECALWIDGDMRVQGRRIKNYYAPTSSLEITILED